jgi:hypothetical protein
VSELILHEQLMLRKEMEMKKYMTPEMEVVELKFTTPLLAGSGEPEEDGGGSTSDPNNPGGW